MIDDAIDICLGKQHMACLTRTENVMLPEFHTRQRFDLMKYGVRYQVIHFSVQYDNY